MRVAKIKIVRKPWSGWVKKQTKSTEKVISLQEGESIYLKGLPFGQYELKVVKINSNSINIEPVGVSPTPVNEEGGINLKGSIGEVTLMVGKSVKLATRTMDAGVIWEISLKGLGS